ncbi:hypothetical protein DFH09DRAFT_936347 [Mycena vulgaris]|nr:hypothetical protein DFH09DRAFT_936347 [Mycena vulgaris]
MANLLDALRTGRLRVVDRPPENTVFCPRMEIHDDPDSRNTVATFEVPGVKVSDLCIALKPGELEIRGERLARHRANPRRHPSLRGPSQITEVNAVPSRTEAESITRFFPYRELRYGSFYRRLRLPSDADISCLTATLSDGLLTVSWPRSPSSDRFTLAETADSHVERETSSVRSDPQHTALK